MASCTSPSTLATDSTTITTVGYWLAELRRERRRLTVAICKAKSETLREELRQQRAQLTVEALQEKRQQQQLLNRTNNTSRKAGTRETPYRCRLCKQPHEGAFCATSTWLVYFNEG